MWKSTKNVVLSSSTYATTHLHEAAQAVQSSVETTMGVASVTQLAGGDGLSGFLWSICALVIIHPLYAVFRFGPRWQSVGFWAGRGDAEICTELTGMKETFWLSSLENQEACTEKIMLNFMSFLVVVFLVVGGTAGYRICVGMWRWHTFTKPMLCAMRDMMHAGHITYAPDEARFDNRGRPSLHDNDARRSLRYTDSVQHRASRSSPRDARDARSLSARIYTPSPTKSPHRMTLTAQQIQFMHMWLQAEMAGSMQDHETTQVPHAASL
jgi:hypothetical protein